MKMRSGIGKHLGVWFLTALCLVGCTKKQPEPPPGVQNPGQQNPQPQMNKVNGSVTFEGTPLVLGMVMLFDSDNKQVGGGPIFSDGSFMVMGPPEGEYNASLMLRNLPVDDNPKKEEGPTGQPPGGNPPNGPPMPPGGGRPGGPPMPPGGGGPPGGPGGSGGPGMGEGGRRAPLLHSITSVQKARYDRIDPKYEDPLKSGLKVKVVKGTSQIPVWELQAATAPEKKTP